jgi:hypothetical protein
MPDSHTIQEGEHISTLADLFGFTNWHSIWDYGDNAQLRKDRKYPHCLHPDDVVAIPDKQQKTDTKPTGKVHPFILDTSPLYLRFRLEDVNGNNLAGTECTVLLADPGTEDPLTTDGDGIAEEKISKRVKTGTVTAKPDGKPDIKYDLLIGSLRDQETYEGQRQRLNNLGYFAGFSKDDTDQFWWAAEEFLCDTTKARVTKTPSIDPDKGVVDASGNSDQDFIGKLVKAHGV